MCVQFQRDGFTLNQETLIREYLDAHLIANANPVYTPTALHQDTEGYELLDTVKLKIFRTLAGGLLWIARCTRPDIAFAVHQMTQRILAPREADIHIGKRVLRYLRITAHLQLCMTLSTQGALALSACIDADFVAQKSYHKSISAATIHLNGLIVFGFAPSRVTCPYQQWNPNSSLPRVASKNIAINFYAP